MNIGYWYNRAYRYIIFEKLVALPGEIYGEKYGYEIDWKASKYWVDDFEFNNSRRNRKK